MSVLSSDSIARTWSSTRPISRSMRSTIAAWTAILFAWKSRCSVVRSFHGSGRFTSFGPSFLIASGKA